MVERAIYYDTETTGVKADKDRVIEIAFYDATLKKSYCSFVNPGMPIPDESTEITGITNEMVKDAPTFQEIAREMLKFCEGDVYLIAHNNDAFDIYFLQEEFRRAHVQMPEYKFIDTLKWARRYRSDLPRHSLQYLREVYGIAENNAHRALDDVMVLYNVFTQMIGDLPMSKVHELLYLQKRAVKHMPFGKHRGKLLSDLPRHYVAWLKDSGALEKAENKELKESLLALSSS